MLKKGTVSRARKMGLAKIFGLKELHILICRIENILKLSEFDMSLADTHKETLFSIKNFTVY